MVPITLSPGQEVEATSQKTNPRRNYMSYDRARHSKREDVATASLAVANTHEQPYDYELVSSAMYAISL